MRTEKCGDEYVGKAKTQEASMDQNDALCCAECDDGDGNCVFPYYGVAPHTHEAAYPAEWLGSTRLLPRDQWGGNFREDEDAPGHGTYLRCGGCGGGACC